MMNFPLGLMFFNNTWLTLDLCEKASKFINEYNLIRLELSLATKRAYMLRMDRSN